MLESVCKRDARRPVAMVVNLVLRLPAQSVGKRKVGLHLPVILIKKRSVDQVRGRLCVARNVDKLGRPAAGRLNLRKGFAEAFAPNGGRIALGGGVGDAACRARAAARVCCSVYRAACGGAASCAEGEGAVEARVGCVRLPLCAQPAPQGDGVSAQRQLSEIG